MIFKRREKCKSMESDPIDSLRYPLVNDLSKHSLEYIYLSLINSSPGFKQANHTYQLARAQQPKTLHIIEANRAAKS